MDGSAETFAEMIENAGVIEAVDRAPRANGPADSQRRIG
jgi:UDP-3-O-acyl-N-acetylglucosamine deacetylase